jgi:hypothetical protein
MMIQYRAREVMGWFVTSNDYRKGCGFVFLWLHMIFEPFLLTIAIWNASKTACC